MFLIRRKQYHIEDMTLHFTALAPGYVAMYTDADSALRHFEALNTLAYVQPPIADTKLGMYFYTNNIFDNRDDIIPALAELYEKEFYKTLPLDIDYWFAGIDNEHNFDIPETALKNRP